MLNFMTPELRKGIYNTFAILNAAIVAAVPVAVELGVMPANWSDGVLQAAAGILSAAGFFLASSNTTTKKKAAKIAVAKATPKPAAQNGLLVVEGQQGPVIAE